MLNLIWKTVKLWTDLYAEMLDSVKPKLPFRAAFKTIQDSKQVAYLVPTTILAQQHFNTFLSRMQNFPVKVEMMSRFRTPKQQREIINGLKTEVLILL